MFFKRIPNPIHGPRKTIFDENNSDRSFYLKHSFEVREELTRLLAKIDYNILMLNYQMWDPNPIKDIKLHKDNKLQLTRLQNMRKRVSRELSIIADREFKTADNLPGFTQKSIDEVSKRPLTPFQKDVRWFHAQLNALFLADMVPTLYIGNDEKRICACSTNIAIDLSKDPQKMFNVWQTLWIITDVVLKTYRGEASILRSYYPTIKVADHGGDGYQDPFWLSNHYSRSLNNKFEINIDKFLEYFYEGLMDVKVFLDKISFLSFLNNYHFDETLENFKEPLRSRLYESINKSDQDFDKYLTDKDSSSIS